MVWSAIALKAAPGALLVAGHVRRDPRALVAIALSITAGSVLEAAWLVLIWTSSVVTLAIVAGLFRLLMKAAGLTF